MDNEKRKQLYEYTLIYDAKMAVERIQFTFPKGSEERQAIERAIEAFRKRQEKFLEALEI